MALKEELKLMKVVKLFSLISNYQDDNDSAQKAFFEFYSRYNKRFWDVCAQICKFNNIEDDLVIKEIVNISFREIFLKSSSYFEYLLENDLEKKIDQDEDEKIFGWLNLIAEEVVKEYIDESNSFNRVHILVDNYKEYQMYLKTFQPEIENEQERIERGKEDDKIEDERRADKKKLRNELAKLRSRDRAILLESMKLKDSGRRRSKDEIDYICRQHDVTYTNLLKISKRSYVKLEDRCKENGEKQAEEGTGTYPGRAKTS